MKVQKKTREKVQQAVKKLKKDGNRHNRNTKKTNLRV